MNNTSSMNAKSTTQDPVGRPVDFYKAAGYAPEESVGYLMRRIISLLAQEVERELEPEGLTHAQWVPLFMLSSGRATTGAELARECSLDAGAMTRLVDRLEAKGLCRRERSSEDRRVVKLDATVEGREAIKVVPQVLSRVQNTALSGFTREEWQALKDMLHRILNNVQAMQASRENHVE
ncbi:MAG: MarR family transcriptional regulator [Curvibacter sp. PD_MW3]|nr:MAG: MarR family transcriptional regulator [Curvibacter sp. PD_MW3]